MAAEGSWRAFHDCVARTLVICMLCAPVEAQESEATPIHWAYASFFGSGRYEFGDSPAVRVFRFDYRRPIREPSLAGGERRIGVTLRLPVTLGRQDEPIGSARALFESGVSTVSFVPGVEFPIPLGEHWTIKPLVNVGYGRALRERQSAWIYRTGLRSRFAFSGEKFDWALTNSLLLIGFAGAKTPAQQALPLTTGIEARIPLRNRKLGEDPVFLHWHIAQTHYLDELRLLERDNETLLELDREWELGAAFSKGDKRLRLKRLSWQQVGIAFRLDSDGDLAGIRFNFRSLFDR